MTYADGALLIVVGIQAASTALLLERTRRSVREDKDERQFFYDGSTLAVWLKEEASWASAPVPATVAEMIALVRGKHALELPLDDLIRDAVRKELLKDVTAGIVIGTGPGRGCRMRSPGLP